MAGFVDTTRGHGLVRLRELSWNYRGIQDYLIAREGGSANLDLHTHRIDRERQLDL